MAITIPTTQESKAANLSNLESEIGQSAPLADKAFLKVLAAMEALAQTGLYKYALERALQNLALTATGEDLERIGEEYDVIKTAATSAVLTATLPATDGTSISPSIVFVGDSNGLRYYPDATVVASGGVATLSLTCNTPGIAGNLSVSDTLTIGSQIAGATTTATVSAVDTIAEDEETQEAYRERVLFAIRSSSGGGNATAYKEWAEEVSGVLRAYPYAGRFDGGDSTPADRTIFIEATTGVDPDGIPTAGLLDSVRDNINTDPDSGKSRPPLGLVDDDMYVEAITRTAFNVDIANLSVEASLQAQAQADIDDALTDYFLSLRPYVPAIDIEVERNDLITNTTISKIVQDTLAEYGASCDSITFDDGITVPLTNYTLSEGETAKVGTVTYA